MNAFTTRIEASTSCSTDIAELSSCFTFFQEPFSCPTLVRDTQNSNGLAANGHDRQRHVDVAITYSIATSVSVDETNGMTPLTAMLWMDCASDWSRYIESAVPFVSW